MPSLPATPGSVDHASHQDSIETALGFQSSPMSSQAHTGEFVPSTFWCSVWMTYQYSQWEWYKLLRSRISSSTRLSSPIRFRVTWSVLYLKLALCWLCFLGSSYVSPQLNDYNAIAPVPFFSPYNNDTLGVAFQGRFSAMVYAQLMFPARGDCATVATWLVLTDHTCLSISLVVWQSTSLVIQRKCLIVLLLMTVSATSLMHVRLTDKQVHTSQALTIFILPGQFSCKRINDVHMWIAMLVSYIYFRWVEIPKTARTLNVWEPVLCLCRITQRLRPWKKSK